MDTAEMKEFFLEAIRPYEEKIEQLEELNEEKEREIVTLKHAIFNLSRIIESFKNVVDEEEGKPETPTPAAATSFPSAGKSAGAKPTSPVKPLRLPTEPYVPGYNGKTARNNIHFVEDSVLVFTNGPTAVVYNIDTEEQELFQQHTGEIISLSVH
jgi:hypothetical protein